MQEEHQVHQQLQDAGDHDHRTGGEARGQTAAHHHPERDDGEHRCQQEANQVGLDAAVALAAGTVCMIVMCGHYIAPDR
ncbi:hypothetical protein D3C81_1130360 [compost metagenome]